MRKNYEILVLLLGISFQLSALPKLTLIIVIDQFAYHEFQKHEQTLQGGIKFLRENGLVFTNVYQEHGAPVTAPGHAALSTGTWPCTHGIINNSWFDQRGKKVKCDADHSPAAALLNSTELNRDGASAHHLMVDTLADQIMLNQPEQFNVFSLALKRRASIMMAGRLGKSLWFDDQAGQFTSSRAFFKALPAWVTAFKNIPPLDTKDFLGSAQASKLVLDFAYYLIDHHLKLADGKNLVLWLNVSNLDKTGHKYGPDHPQTIKILHAIDEQLGTFFKQILTLVPAQETCILLTADHGVMSVPEVANQNGIDFAQRISKKSLINYINEYVEQYFGLVKLVQHGQLPFLYLDTEQLNMVSEQEQEFILETIKSLLLSIHGIRHVWTAKELAASTFEPTSIDNFLKNQQYTGRSGQLVIKVMPYVLMVDHPTGTKHNTPYEYNTHVPLFLYQPGTFEHAIIPTRANSRQVAPTLAHILNVPKPSACTENMLPGIS